MARKRKSGVTARQDSEARDVKDDRDSDEPIALREDAEECDEGARAADLDEHALLLEELAQLRRALEKREIDSSYSTRTCVRSSTVPYCTQ
jgi:hypothetical protein